MIAAVGPFDRVTGGDDQVILDGLPVARLGDLTADGGTIVEGSPTIFINGVPAAFYGGFAVNPVVLPGPVPRVGGPILRCTDDLKTCIDEHPHPIALLVEPARQGDTVLEVDAKGFNVGDSVIIGIDNDSAETAKIEATGSMVLDRPLTRDHPAGAAVIRIPDEHADKVPPPSSATGTDTPMSRLLTTASGDGGGNTALIVGAVAIGALVLVAGAILLARRPRR